MTLELTPQTNLESLRKDAKRRLKAIQAGNPEMSGWLQTIYPEHKGQTLRTVQHAIALEHGFPSWAALKRELDERALAARSHADRVVLFLEKSANRYGVAPGRTEWNTYEPDRPARGELAARLLARHPEIARDSIHTAVAAHDIEAVREFLSKDPSLADQPGGPEGWKPLLRLAYTRIPIAALALNAVSIASALLDHGADPKAEWSDGENSFTVLTGVIGGGEGRQTAHPQAELLARLLISRGAEPFDKQALYNTSLDADSTLWLDLLWTESNKRGEAGKWTAVEPRKAGGVSQVNYLLGNAVPHHPQRARWLLEHGASANAVNFYSKQPVVKAAALAGSAEVFDLLVRHGAEPPVLTSAEEFLAAATRGDGASLRKIAEAHPEYLRGPHAMFAAIRLDRPDIVQLLLELGTSPNAADPMGFSALHFTTHCGAKTIAELLIARGADVDPIERRYNSTPLGHANYQGRREMIDAIAPFSRDVRGLCFSGATNRLAELLAADRSLASTMTRGGEAPLFALPDDDERAVEVVELLLAHGADPSVKNAAGLTPAQAAKKRGLDDAAEAIGAAEP